MSKKQCLWAGLNVKFRKSPLKGLLMFVRTTPLVRTYKYNS